MANFARNMVELFRCRSCGGKNPFSLMFNRVMCVTCAEGHSLTTPQEVQA